MELFVKPDNTVDVEVFVYEKDGNVLATNDTSDIPKEVGLEIKTLKFIFRKPSYQDSVEIMSKSQNKNIAPTEGSPITIDPNGFNSAILYTLLKDWDIEDSKGIKMSVNQRNINSLQPAIARAAVAGCLRKVSI